LSIRQNPQRIGVLIALTNEGIVQVEFSKTVESEEIENFLSNLVKTNNGCSLHMALSKRNINKSYERFMETLSSDNNIFVMEIPKRSMFLNPIEHAMCEVYTFIESSEEVNNLETLDKSIREAFKNINPSNSKDFISKSLGYLRKAKDGKPFKGPILHPDLD
jgi:benzoyl-CoA reductase/2-hydroxyglutaryl-CoA dehydratase subunit BcrC/BadD/HgdB